MIERDLTDKLKAVAKSFPAVTVTGPRQSGKSTLCGAVFPKHAYANLETPDVRSFALGDPRGFLAQYPHGAILDEVQSLDRSNYIFNLSTGINKESNLESVKSMVDTVKNYRRNE